MSSVAEAYGWMTETRYLGPARVLEVDEGGSRVLLRLKETAQAVEAWAQMAIPGPQALAPDDTALVVGEDLSELYVIGVLNGGKAEAASAKVVALRSGAYAKIVRTQASESLQVFSRKCELLFEYDEESGKARVNVESDDLEFVTRKGNIAFKSAQDIQFHGQSVQLTSSSAIRLGVMDTVGKIRSALTLRPRRIKLHSPELNISAERGDLEIEETRHTGKRLKTELRQAKLEVDRLETLAGTLIQKAKNVYRTVEQLSQLKTGRMRTLVDTTYHFKSKRAFVKSEKDYKIRAEQIHLG